MKKFIAMLMCLVILASFTACGQTLDITPDTTTTIATTLDEVLDHIEQNTTATEYPDGTTVYTYTSGTENPVFPTSTPTSTTTRKKPTGTTSMVTTAPTTTTAPPPIPTMPPTTTTTTTTTTTKNSDDDNVTSTTSTTTTIKTFNYEYTTNQTHTWLPLSKRYLYSLLNEEWKGYYRQIDAAVRNLDASVDFATNLSEDRRYQIYFLYAFDTPELFYLCNYVSIHNYGDGTSGLAFYYAVSNKAGDYCGTGRGDLTDALRTKIRAKKATFDSAVAAFASTIPSSAPDVVKERLVYDRILKTSHYNLGAQWDGLAEDNWTAYGILVNHYGVCESYSEAFQTMCYAVGINCTGIVGTAGGGHKWNAIQLDGDWYMCDITFDDPIGGDPNGAYHTYFNLTSDRMRELNHSWPANNWEGYFSFATVPNCTATKYSFENFVKLYGQ